MKAPCRYHWSANPGKLARLVPCDVDCEPRGPTPGLLATCQRFGCLIACIHVNSRMKLLRILQALHEAKIVRNGKRSFISGFTTRYGAFGTDRQQRAGVPNQMVVPAEGQRNLMGEDYNRAVQPPLHQADTTYTAHSGCDLPGWYL